MCNNSSPAHFNLLVVIVYLRMVDYTHVVLLTNGISIRIHFGIGEND